MSATRVLQQAKALSPSERKELLRLLQEIIAVDDGQKPKPSLRDLAGLGKECWQGVDVDAYLNELRDEWDAASCRLVNAESHKILKHGGESCP